MTATQQYDTGLSHEQYKACGKNGHYRDDLGLYFLDGANEPPFIALDNMTITADGNTRAITGYKGATKKAVITGTGMTS